MTVASVWNYKTVDGFGREVVAGNTIGDTTQLSTSFAERGTGFGFAAIAGLAATFTACNCVVLATLPGLACTTDKASSRQAALRALGAFTAGVVVVGAFYGMFIGFLGPDGITFFNERPVRLALAQGVFTSLGIVMLLWGAIELGFLKPITARTSEIPRAFLAMPNTTALLMGTLVGLSTVGRPFPVSRELLTYAATATSPLYGAAVMTVQGIGPIAVMAVIFLALVYGFGDRLTKWVSEKPEQPALVSAVALIGGGAYFVYYGASRSCSTSGGGASRSVGTREFAQPAEVCGFLPPAERGSLPVG